MTPVFLFAQALRVPLPAALAYVTAPTDTAVMTTPSVNAPKRVNFISVSFEGEDVV
jgi:hypothetical protein